MIFWITFYYKIILIKIFRLIFQVNKKVLNTDRKYETIFEFSIKEIILFLAQMLVLVFVLLILLTISKKYV